MGCWYRCYLRIYVILKRLLKKNPVIAPGFLLLRFYGYVSLLAARRAARPNSAVAVEPVFFAA